MFIPSSSAIPEVPDGRNVGFPLQVLLKHCKLLLTLSGKLWSAIAKQFSIESFKLLTVKHYSGSIWKGTLPLLLLKARTHKRHMTGIVKNQAPVVLLMMIWRAWNRFWAASKNSLRWDKATAPWGRMVHVKSYLFLQLWCTRSFKHE